MQLDYAVIIATRNRPAALRLSIPRILGQSRKPAQLIVVDSSDDHLATVEAVKDSVGNNPVELTIRHSEPNSSAQRNLGLTFVTSPVVFFPDDDSIWFSGAAAAQMNVYERDQNGQIAAVCAAESSMPPLDWEPREAGAYQMRLSHRVQQRVAAKRAKFQNAIFPDPAKILGRSFWPSSKDVPPWFKVADVAFVEYMTGFRMSFRTKVIQIIGFDEALERYSLCEDIDASLGAWGMGWVVGVLNAKVFHYRSPEVRGDDKMLGIIQVLNKAYVIVKRTQPDDQFRHVLVRFIKSKIMTARITSIGRSERTRLQGMMAGVSQLSPLMNATSQTASEVYRRALQMAVSQADATMQL